MSTNPPLDARLQKLLQEGATELYAALAESTNLDEKLSAALEAATPGGQNPSPLTRMLRAGDAELRMTLAGSTDVEQKLTETLHEATYERRALTLAYWLAQGHMALSSVAPDVPKAAASWKSALEHARAIGQGVKVEGIVADTVLGAANALQRGGDVEAACAMLEAAYGLLGEGRHSRLKGQLARALTDRSIMRANADLERLEGSAVDLRRAVELNPHSHRAQVNLGVVLRILADRMRWSGSLVGASNKLNDAVDRLTDALAYLPGDRELTELRALVQDDLALVHSELEQGQIRGLSE
ncbi:hypothetical protein ABZ916_23580 [Streptomyces sp. NPDC046853]|uniref:hypothetical protein n=1 Tax=Streptomyces sp. NPDC046853 TaxID=3154920 RepID=UPI0033EB9EFE